VHPHALYAYSHTPPPSCLTVRQAFFAASRLALAQLGAVAYTAVAASVFIATTPSTQGTATPHGSPQGASGGSAAAVNPYLAQSRPSGRGGSGRWRGPRAPFKNVAMELADASVLVGNGACLVGWLLASYCASASFTMDASSGGGGGGLRSLATSMPLTLLLLFLRDDHGLLHGLSSGNRYAPSIFACQVQIHVHRIIVLLVFAKNKQISKTKSR